MNCSISELTADMAILCSRELNEGEGVQYTANPVRREGSNRRNHILQAIPPSSPKPSRYFTTVVRAATKWNGNASAPVSPSALLIAHRW